MREFLWRLFAMFICIEPLKNWLILRSFRTPYTHLKTRDGRETYMQRFWLFNPYDPETRKAKYPWLPLSARIHHICLPDEAVDLHDHPWDARSIILDGSYVELREDGEYHLRAVGDTVRLNHNEFHRIVDVEQRLGAVTLFITFRYRGTWGFLVDGKKVPFREYLGES